MEPHRTMVWLQRNIHVSIDNISFHANNGKIIKAEHISLLHPICPVNHHNSYEPSLEINTSLYNQNLHYVKAACFLLQDESHYFHRTFGSACKNKALNPNTVLIIEFASSMILRITHADTGNSIPSYS